MNSVQLHSHRDEASSPWWQGWGERSTANTLAYAQPSSPLPYKFSKIVQEKIKFFTAKAGKVRRKKNSRKKLATLSTRKYNGSPCYFNLALSIYLGGSLRWYFSAKTENIVDCLFSCKEDNLFKKHFGGALTDVKQGELKMYRQQNKTGWSTRVYVKSWQNTSLF